jgi:hypothetical protein
MFLRGVDNKAGKDPDSAERTENRPGGHRGDAVGSVQSDAVGHHTHKANSVSTAAPHHHDSRAPGGTGSSGQSGHDQGLIPEPTTDAPVSITTTTTVEEAGGKETRAKNAYVIWLIRVQ